MTADNIVDTTATLIRYGHPSDDRVRTLVHIMAGGLLTPHRRAGSARGRKRARMAAWHPKGQ